MSKTKTVTLGLLQHACVADPKANLKKNLSLVAQAAKQGAQIICTQEMVTSQYFCQSEEHRFFDLVADLLLLFFTEPGATFALFVAITVAITVTLAFTVEGPRVMVFPRDEAIARATLKARPAR